MDSPKEKEEGEEKVAFGNDPQDPQKKRGRPRKLLQEEVDKERGKGVSVVGEEEAPPVHEKSPPPPCERDLCIEEDAGESKQGINVVKKRRRRKGIPRRAPMS